ncbi:unnamed protein product [Ceutorhynchus assimilis]|uniref:Phosphoenolpyruvate synthase n=1 Tax=Ceutorhynchus assimilis TaxID=467358 RepID=A0A9N9MZG9_9CUCU|nr:unnamed protein product [Ceutorhynchus assimilis]
MDLYSFMTFEVFLFVPFVVYFLFFKKNEGRSLYSGRDLFYPIKYFFAKQVVEAAQENSRRDRAKLVENDIEPEISFSSEKEIHCQTFKACDQKGNSIQLRFTLRPSKLAEVILVLKLANGHLYTFPNRHQVHLTSVKETRWKINGLTIESLDPYRRVRIVYNGLLRCLGKIEHVQFNFIFNCCSAPKFFPEDCDTKMLSETLATRPWRDASWKQFLSDQIDGYEQFGSMLGFVKGDSFPEEQVLNLAAHRSIYSGPDKQFSLKRDLQIFLAETNGVLVALTLQLFKEEESQLNYGHIFHKNNITVPITAQDIKIQKIGKDKIFPDLFVARINTRTDEYICAFNLDKSSITNHEYTNGSESILIPVETEINVSHGKALMDFQYYDQTKEIKNHHLNLKPILSEKKVEELPDDFVANIKEDNAKILEITGGKGNSLALLSSLGSNNEFLVPDGFVITTNAFKYQLAQSKLLRNAVEKVNDVFCGISEGKKDEVCALAVRLFTNEPVHPEIASIIEESLGKMPKNGEIEVDRWAVRSSAVGEDSEELSAAGQNETILGVAENNILRAVSKCWASLFTYQSVQYRWQHGLAIKADMAVVVQRMVPAEAAGVLFTWHPTTSNPSQMVITSNFGLGESVVSGKSEPDTFVLNRTYDGVVSLNHQTLGAKDKMITLAENGVKEVNCKHENSFVFVDDDNQDAKEIFSLNEEQVLRLGRVGVMLEEAFGGPRDIEWAFFKNDLYLLQSRPITTLNAWTDFELTHELDTPCLTENSLFTMANAGEVFPVATSALSRTSTLNKLDEGMQRCIYSTVDRYFFKAMCIFHHRVMLDCITTVFKQSRNPTIGMDSKVLDLAIFGHPVVNEKISLMVRTRLGPLTWWEGFQEKSARFKEARNVVKIANAAVESAKALDFEINDDDDVETIHQKILCHENNLTVPFQGHASTTAASVFWQMVCMMVLVGREKELNVDHYADFANILSSCDDVESAEVPLFLEKIANIIRDAGFSDEFCSIEQINGVNWLETNCPEAYKVFEEFLSKHGHRCLGEFEMMEEPWGINPSLVIPMIQANIKHGHETTKEHKTIREVVSNLVSRVKFPATFILRWALSYLRIAVGKREQSKSAAILVIHKARLAYRKLASKMVMEGILPSESLVFHFTKHELEQVIKRKNPLLINKALRRQRLHENWKELKFPELSYGLPEPEKDFTPVELLPGTKCIGTPVCTGSVQARACVITHLDEIETLEKGDILITYCTDIGWSPYFPLLSGVVTELGGLVSHGAVVAREYGLPCIVGVKNVTKIFRTGDLVHLNGKTGELGKVE